MPMVRNIYIRSYFILWCKEKILITSNLIKIILYLKQPIIFKSSNIFITDLEPHSTIGPRQANLVLIAYASSEGSGEPAHPRSLARTSAARSYKQWVKRNLQQKPRSLAPLNGWACAVKFVMTECLKTQIRLTCHKFYYNPASKVILWAKPIYENS